MSNINIFQAYWQAKLAIKRQFPSVSLADIDRLAEMTYTNHAVAEVPKKAIEKKVAVKMRRVSEAPLKTAIIGALGSETLPFDAICERLGSAKKLPKGTNPRQVVRMKLADKEFERTGDSYKVRAPSQAKNRKPDPARKLIRKKATQTVGQAIHTVLLSHPLGLSVEQLKMQIEKAGTKINSRNKTRYLTQYLSRDMQKYERLTRGVYRLRAETPALPSKAS